MEEKKMLTKAGDMVFVIDNLAVINGEVVSVVKLSDYFNTERTVVKFSGSTGNSVKSFLKGSVFLSKEEAQQELYKQLDNIKSSAQVSTINEIYQKANEICNLLERTFPTLISKGKDV